MPHTISAEMRRCIDECLRCAATCTETSRHCLELGGKHAEPEHITTLEVCADICLTSANSMLRGSRLYTETCRACAAVCRACEEACRRMGDDPMMQQCADVCRSCAESCERMAGTGTGH